jgi:hypothetical protein
LHLFKEIKLIEIVTLLTTGILINLGFIQISDKIRKNNWKLHIWLGRFFAIAVLFIAIEQIVFSFHENFSILGSSGVRLTAFILAGFMIQGLRFMFKRRMFAHGIWMKRTMSALVAIGVSKILVLLLNIDGTDDAQALTAYLFPMLLIVAGYEMKDTFLSKKKQNNR